MKVIAWVHSLSDLATRAIELGSMDSRGRLSPHEHLSLQTILM
jgi:hypothetical protein